MTTLKFKCTLLSDVILNQKAATEGPNKTLDFIPGSCFLGIVASRYDKYTDEEAWTVFHSGRVRFGDAHPSTDGGCRTLKVPASMYYPKMRKASEECYIHHAITDINDEEIRGKQLKQCRSGFYDFSNQIAQQVRPQTSFAIKSAYDSDKRRSEDEKMYGYESLRKGTLFFFTVEVDDDQYAETINEALCGRKHIGRSRTAQYGLVDIERDSFGEIESRAKQGDEVVVYADGRLVFIDDCGQPTFRPTPKDLGIGGDDAEIVWEKSQVRTFQYSPWNYKRQCFDTDRCGIEKGSVIVVRTSANPQSSCYVGVYRNEGFGRVIYNPEFLSATTDGKAVFTLKEKNENKGDTQERTISFSIDTPLTRYLKQQIDNEDTTSEVYKTINEWMKKNSDVFIGKEKFASQWGAIRSIAMSVKDDSQIKKEVITYIEHGIKKDDWTERGRRGKLELFMNSCSDSNIREMLVNLAAEMAKKCRKEVRK